MQRLFSTFPNSWPGRGLFLQRVVTAIFLFSSVFGRPIETPQFALAILLWIGAGAGILLLFGLWTPISGTFIGVLEAWIACSSPGSHGVSILLATSGASLAMIGPGAWSIDARLFGRKHFEIPQR